MSDKLKTTISGQPTHHGVNILLTQKAILLYHKAESDQGTHYIEQINCTKTQKKLILDALLK